MSAYLEKASTAQLTRINAADRLFSVPFNTHNKCTGVCRFVRGIPVGIRHRVAALWGFCGLAEASGWVGRPPWSTQVPGLPNPDDHFPGNSASPVSPARL